MSKPILIVGSGLAGITVAREFRKLAPDQDVLIVTADDGGFYSKPSLSTALAAGKQPAQLMLTPADVLARQTGVRILPHVRVERIDTAAAAIDTSAGRLEYERLVLATGARQIRLPLSGDGVADILAVNSLDDYAEFRRKLEGCRAVAIIGAGLIGCEFANDLRRGGYEVAVHDVAPRLLARLLPPRASAFLQARLEEEGVQFRFCSELAAVHREDGGYRLTDRAGASTRADLVLSAVGLAPAMELAQAAGIATRRGIVVDRLLRTSAPGVFALGDCAEVEGHLLPYVQPIMLAARALARTLAGTPTAVAYPAMPVMVKTPACAAVLCPPPQGRSGTWQESVGPQGARAVHCCGDGGETLGFALLGDAAGERQQLAAQLPAWL